MNNDKTEIAKQPESENTAACNSMENFVRGRKKIAIIGVKNEEIKGKLIAMTKTFCDAMIILKEKCEEVKTAFKEFERITHALPPPPSKKIFQYHLNQRQYGPPQKRGKGKFRKYP